MGKSQRRHVWEGASLTWQLRSFGTRRSWIPSGVTLAEGQSVVVEDGRIADVGPGPDRPG